jgi:hypothetical protein
MRETVAVLAITLRLALPGTRTFLTRTIATLSMCVAINASGLVFQVCRICEELVRSELLEEHTQYCVIVEKYDVASDPTDVRLANLVQGLTERKEMFEKVSATDIAYCQVSFAHTSCTLNAIRTRNAIAVRTHCGSRFCFG